MENSSVAPVDGIERLNQVLDDLVMGRVPVRNEADEEILAVVRGLAACRDAPPPDARFLERLATKLQREGEMQASTARQETTISSGAAQRGEVGRVVVWPIRRLAPLIEMAAVAALLFVLASALFGRDALESAVRGIWQDDATPIPVEAGDVSMLGVDPARRGMQPGPGPDGEPGLLWRRYLMQVMRPPAVVDGMIYVSAGGGVIAVESSTSKVVWDSRGLTSSNASTPAVVDGVVYVGGTRSTETPQQGPDEGAIYALDAATGKVLWESPTGGSAGSSPVVADGVVYITGGKAPVPSVYDYLFAFDARTGLELWRYEIAGAGSSSAPFSPAVADGTVFVSDGGGRLHALDAKTGHLRWVYQVPGGHWLTLPVVADGLVLVGTAEDFPRGNLTGELFAVDAATGELSWRAPVSAYSSPSVADGVVYVAGRKTGGHAVYALDLATGRELWQTAIEEAGYSPVIAGSTIYVGTWEGSFGRGTEGVIVALNAASGGVDWILRVDGGVPGGVVVTGGVVYTGTTSGLLYAIGGNANADVPVTPAPDGNLRMLGACTAPRVVYPLAEPAGATPEPSVIDPIDTADGIRADQLPTGEPVGAPVIEEIEATIAALERCIVGDELSRLYGFYSADFFLRPRTKIRGQLPPELMTLEFGWRFSPFDEVRVIEARRLADGRVGVVVEGSFDKQAFVVFVQDGDRWQIDDVAEIVPADNATPTSGDR